MNNTKEQEVWKTYPDYDFIEASNLGRVRTRDRYVPGKNGSKRLVRGRVLKQQLGRGGYMYVEFSVNGKAVCLLSHRIIAVTFIPNPNNYPQVNHKDNNPKNNAVSNLEWCTCQYNQDYKRNFGTSAAQIFGRPVYAVDLKTGKVLRFETQSEAARQLGVDIGDLNKVVNGKMIQIGSYWFTEDENKITEEKIQEIKDNMLFLGGVIAINLETSEVYRFKSQSEAARKLGVDVGNINHVLKGKQNKTGDYWFCYVDEKAVGKARSKFGNKIAEKVEELMNNELQSI